jgi:hypothetical protein
MHCPSTILDTVILQQLEVRYELYGRISEVSVSPVEGVVVQYRILDL